MVLDTRFPPTFCAFISGGRWELEDEVREKDHWSMHACSGNPQHLK